ncbi:MAG TPA: hypothetical protein VNZ49_05585 [Bacteroidia bacterium]|nr:hypothetical protein [Bacteroidia bacterium]
MKKILLALLLLVFASSFKAQNDYTDLAGRWRLGLNMGAIWESSDVKAIPGLGGGFNLEKILNKRNDVFLGFSLGFRYLGGRTFGLNTAPQYNLQNNSALNGQFDTVTNYATKPGYFYANHKTYIQDGNLELKMNFPSLEKHTGIIFHIWGSVGICKYKTWINAKDANGNKYDFSAFKQQEVSQSDLSKVFNGSYGTLADGSGTNGTLAFIPSVGAGIGYRLSKHVALVFEHKISFPGTDKLDGFVYAGKSCANDFYHYTSANLIFTLYGSNGSSHTSTTHTNNTVYTNPTGTQTVNTNPTIITTPKIYPPNVIITYPVNYYSSQYDNVNISATLQNVTSSQQIGISLNGTQLQHFSFNPSNGHLNFQSFLALGNNNFVVTANNGGGISSDNVTVIYNPQFTTGEIVVPTNTTVPTNTVAVNTNTVSIHTTNTVVPTNTVIPTNTVTVNTNTVSIHTNTVVPTNTVTVNTNTVSIHTNTVVTTSTVTVNTNTVSITPTNTTITTTTTTATGPVGVPPAIQIINPPVSGQTESNMGYNISASILHIASGNDVTITVNGVGITQFTYSSHNAMLNFNAPLQDGQNIIIIHATNAYGADNKNTIINHHAGKPPKVIISNPNTNPYNTVQPNVLVNGFVHYVNGSADVKVTLNGNMVPFNFNPVTGSTDVNLTLVTENNQLTIAGTNQYGNDVQSIILIYKKLTSTGVGASADSTKNNNASSGVGGGIGHGGGMGGMSGSHTVPAISVISPVADPFYTNNATATVMANISYVLNVTDVSVSNNGAPVSSYFDINTGKLSFSAPLLSGNNAFIITAHNNYGTSTKQVNINYTPIIINNGFNNNNGSNQQINPIKIGNPGGGMQPKINTGGTAPVINPGRPVITNPVFPKVNPQPTSNPNPPRTINTGTFAPVNNGGGGRKIGGG